MQSPQTQRRTVLITGANKGIGYVTVERLFSESTPFDIILTSRDIKLGEKAIATLQEKYPKSTNTLTYYQLEVNDDKSVENLVAWIKDSNRKIDVLINNAGVCNLKADAEYQKFTIKTNFFSVINLTEKLLPYLSEDAKILQVSSVAGKLAWQGPTLEKALADPNITEQGLYEIANNILEVTADFPYPERWPSTEPSYPASKALLNAYTRRHLPAKLKENQQVYAIHPGWVKTDMGGEHAPGALEDGANTIVYVTNLPFTKDPKFHGQFIGDDFKILEF